MPGRSLEGVWFPRVQNKCLTTARQESSPIIPYIYQTRKYSREPGMPGGTKTNIDVMTLLKVQESRSQAGFAI